MRWRTTDWPRASAPSLSLSYVLPDEQDERRGQSGGYPEQHGDQEDGPGAAAERVVHRHPRRAQVHERVDRLRKDQQPRGLDRIEEYEGQHDLHPPRHAEDRGEERGVRDDGEDEPDEYPRPQRRRLPP